MKITIDDKAMKEKYFKDTYGEEFKEYYDGIEFKKDDSAHIISINDNPIYVYGNPHIINFEDEEIYIQDNCMVCGKGNNRKWRELRDDYGNGEISDPYIMTYEVMLDTFGKEAANSLFDMGVLPEWW